MMTLKRIFSFFIFTSTAISLNFSNALAGGCSWSFYYKKNAQVKELYLVSPHNDPIDRVEEMQEGINLEINPGDSLIVYYRFSGHSSCPSHDLYFVGAENESYHYWHKVFRNDTLIDLADSNGVSAITIPGIYLFEISQDNFIKLNVYHTGETPVGATTVPELEVTIYEHQLEKLQAYPSPNFSGNLTVNVEFSDPTKYSLKVINYLGQEAMTVLSGQNDSGTLQTIDVSGLGKGFYYLVLSYGEGHVATRKFFMLNE